MKKLPTLLGLILLAHLAHSQWLPQTSNPTFIYFNGGPVGIGTSSPQSTLHVVGQTMADVTNSPAFVSKSNLGIVIQQANIGGDFVSSQSYLSIYAHNIQFDGTNWIRRNQYSNTWATVMNHAYYDVQFALSNGNQPANTIVTPSTYLRVLASGNVLIGKTSQINSNYLLDVNGNVRANQVVVNSSGADFVFEPGYSLMPIAELEKYIQTNHHLPGVAAAQEMTQDGLDVGANQTVLLKKIEELTLYVMQQQKEIEQLKKQIKKPSH
jgi:hypothetical protein